MNLRRSLMPISFSFPLFSDTSGVLGVFLFLGFLGSLNFILCFKLMQMKKHGTKF